MPGGLDDFQNFQAESDQEILGSGHLGMKRILARDHQIYEPGALGTKTKELLGLVASAVLRCDDCAAYHLAANRIGTGTQCFDALYVASVVGGSITIAQVRRAFARRCEISGLAP